MKHSNLQQGADAYQLFPYGKTEHFSPKTWQKTFVRSCNIKKLSCIIFDVDAEIDLVKHT